MGEIQEPWEAYLDWERWHLSEPTPNPCDDPEYWEQREVVYEGAD